MKNQLKIKAFSDENGEPLKEFWNTYLGWNVGVVWKPKYSTRNTKKSTKNRSSFRRKWWTIERILKHIPWMKRWGWEFWTENEKSQVWRILKKKPEVWWIKIRRVKQETKSLRDEDLELSGKRVTRSGMEVEVERLWNDWSQRACFEIQLPHFPF